MGDEVDHRGEELPSLSKRSGNVNLERILKLHKPDFSEKSLATPGFWPLIRAMLLYGRYHVLKSTILHYHSDDPNDGPAPFPIQIPEATKISMISEARFRLEKKKTCNLYIL